VNQPARDPSEPPPTSAEPINAVTSAEPVNAVPSAEPDEAAGAALRWFELADALWLAGQQWQADPVSDPSSPAPAPPAAAPPTPPPPADRPGPTTAPPDPVRAGPDPGDPADDTPESGSSHTGRPVDAVIDTGGRTVDELLIDDLVGGPLDWPAVAAIPAASRIMKALRPLKVTTASRTAWVLDEEATASAAAEDGLWLPATKPEAERLWDIVLVVDESESMEPWRGSVRAFGTLLERLGAFRSLGVRSLRTALASPGQLLDPTGRRIVLVLTNGQAPVWRTGGAGRALRSWGQRLPVAVVHLRPQLEWHHTYLRPRLVRLRATAPGCANIGLQWVSRDKGRDLVDGAWPRRVPGTDGQPTTVIPVLELTHRYLDPWARLVAGSAGWTNLTAIRAEDGPPDDPVTAERGDDPWQRVERFRAMATPDAFDLATLFAAAPLNLPVMQAIQSALRPTSSPSHLSEFLNSGLVDHHPGGNRSDQVTVDFEPGVREALLAYGRRTGTAAVVRIVEHYLGSQVEAVRGLRTMLDEPERQPAVRVTRDSVPFLRASHAVLQALSGTYLAPSRWVARHLPPPPLRPGGVARAAPAGSPESGDSDINVLQREDLTTYQGRGAGNIGGTAVTTTAERSTGRLGNQEPSVWGNVPPRNVNFTGREELLTDLHTRLQAGTTAVLPQALHGLGGVGKSQLAVEYLYRHRFNYDLVWWISAERPAQISQSLVELAQRLGVPGGSEANSAVPAVLEALRTGQPYANWLLVYDNAESPDVIWPTRGETPSSLYIPTSGTGKVLITSRNPDWASRANPIEVDVFHRAESTTLLTRRDPYIDPAAADRLATALGDLPLAIEQAAAWRASTGMPVDEYLQLLGEQTTELLELSTPADYPLPVAAAWNIALKRLTVSNRAAWRLLQLCGFYAAEPVSRTLLSGARGMKIHPDLDPVLRSPIQLGQAIREINQLGLARIDHRTNAILMHRLVQVVMRAQLGPEDREEVRLAAQLLLAASDREDPVSPDNWSLYGDLYPHVIASDAVNSTDPYVRELVFNEARYLYYWGDHVSSADLSEKAYEAWRAQLGEEDPQTLEAARWLGFMRLVIGDYAGAAALNAEMLEINRRIHGDDHELTLQAMGAVAADRRVDGDFAAALDLSQQVYDRMSAISEERDPGTLNAAHNLAVSLRLAGEFARARIIDENTWRRKVEIFGTDHDLSLITLAGLNLDRRELGEYLEARSAEEDLVSKYRRLARHEGHPLVLRALRSLSVARRKAGAHAAALEASLEVRQQFVQRYREDHPDTLAASLNLSIDYRTTGDLDRARRLGEDTWQRYRQTLGRTHPHALAAGGALAITLRLSGDADAALAIDTEAAASLADRLGPEHPLTLVAGLNLAGDLFAVGEFDRAHDQDTDAVARMRTAFGPEHPTTLCALANLGLDLRALGREVEGEEVRAEAINGLEGRLGPDHPVTKAARERQRLNVDLDPMPM
jgi:hypothetical protein